MRRAHIGIVLTLVIGVGAADYGQALGGGYLIRHAALVLTMDRRLGDQSVLGQIEDAMESRIGSLTPGKQADVIVLEPRTLNFAPQMQRVNQIVFNGQPQNVAWVFVAGRVLKEKGKLKGVDVGQLIKAAQTATDHIAPFLQP